MERSNNKVKVDVPFKPLTAMNGKVKDQGHIWYAVQQSSGKAKNGKVKYQGNIWHAFQTSNRALAR